MNQQDIKEGDLYSYATINVQSHGFGIRTNEDFCYPVELDSICGVTLRIHSGPMNPNNVSVNPENINKMVWDERARDGASFVLVYRSGKSKEQVLEMLRPQLLEHMIKRKAAYEILVKNAQDMIDALAETCPTDHLCKKD